MKKILYIKDNLYPARLREIYQPPRQLYCIGNSELLNSNNIIAVIGSRDCTKYGKDITLKIAKELVDNSFVVISGLANGIDSYAHIGGIKRTIAVLGSGFNKIYPQNNKELLRKIIANNGLVISEYEPNQIAKPEFFPQRNRIIAGLANLVIVTEAKKNSGTFITVDLALETGKDIYAVPGNITSLNSAGTNELIKNGASLYTNIDDLIIG